MDIMVDQWPYNSIGPADGITMRPQMSEQNVALQSLECWTCQHLLIPWWVWAISVSEWGCSHSTASTRPFKKAFIKPRSRVAVSRTIRECMKQACSSPEVCPLRIQRPASRSVAAAPHVALRTEVKGGAGPQMRPIAESHLQGSAASTSATSSLFWPLR